MPERAESMLSNGACALFTFRRDLQQHDGEVVEDFEPIDRLQEFGVSAGAARRWQPG